MRSQRRAPWKAAVALFSTAVLLVLATANIRSKAVFRLWDDGVLWKERGGALVAERIDPEGPGAEAGLRKGDVLAAVDDEPMDGPEDVRRRLDRLGALDGGAEPVALSYQVVRLETKRALAVLVRPLPRGNVGIYYYLAAVGLFSLLVGTVVYVRRRGIPAAAHFYLLSVFWCLMASFSFTGQLDGLDTAYYWMDWGGILFFPALLLHFSMTFPKRHPLVHRNRWVLPALYLPSTILVVVALGGKLLFFARVPWGDAVFAGTSAALDRLSPLFVGGYSVAAFAGFVRSHRSARSYAIKQQTRWIVWGSGMGSAPFLVFYGLPYAAGASATPLMELSAAPLALVPLTFAYAIVRYRLTDVEVLFKRGMVYSLAAATVIGLYLAVFLTGTRYLAGDPHNTIIAILATMVVVLAFTPVKSRIQVTIDRIFYRDRYDYRHALIALSRDLNSDLDLRRLSTLLVERIADTFGVDKVALLVPRERGADLGVVATRGLEAADRDGIRLGAGSPLLARLSTGEPFFNEELDRSDIGEHLSTDEERIFTTAGFQYAIPCLAKNELVGVFLIGRRRGASALSSEDLDLLLTVSGQAATALENARLYQSLLVKAGEFERLKQHSDNVVESLHAGILVLDLSGRVVRWNRALEQLYGLARAEALGRTLSELFPARLVDMLAASMGPEWWKRAEGSGLHRVNLENRVAQKKVVKVHVAPFVSEGGTTEGTILIFEDITERVELESQLQLREKMASLGLLAAGVAHEVNTPLTGISSFTQMLREQTTESDPRARLLDKIERQTERASKIVNNLLHFSRQGSADFAPVDLNSVVTDVLSLLEHQLEGTKIRVRRELTEGLPPVLGDENKLQQVFLNLILNAQDAMLSGGWLTVATGSRASEVVASVADTGQGISKDDIRRIYDPFFTTKRTGRAGTGLGLSITYGIVQEHSGTIVVESVPGKGTRFEIQLPVVEPAPVRAGGDAGSWADEGRHVMRTAPDEF